MTVTIPSPSVSTLVNLVSDMTIKHFSPTNNSCKEMQDSIEDRVVFTENTTEMSPNTFAIKGKFEIFAYYLNVFHFHNKLLFNFVYLENCRNHYN